MNGARDYWLTDDADSAPVDVVLASMPWAPAHEPSLGLAILKSCLISAGLSTSIFHAAPELLGWVSAETYQFVADCWAVNEFVFTGALDPLFDTNQATYLAAFLSKEAARQRHSRYSSAEELVTLIQVLRDKVAPAFVDDCAKKILARSPKVVGFTCLFDQLMASLAVAKRLRELAPGIKVMFGGYALHGPVAENVAKAFPWIDAIAVGDGETTVVQLAQRLISQGDQVRPYILLGERVDMASVPLPDYADWFSQLRSLEERAHIRVNTKVLPVESSRGCWWGAKSHCVFCGIDDETLKYRYKTAQATLEMLRKLRDLHGDYVFRFADYIMPKAYYEDLLPILAAESPKFRLQSEVKSNHSLERIEKFSAAGYREIQPGIESFSSEVLRRMEKGARGIDNVGLLKAGYVSSVAIDYNVLFGLPGDKPSDYLDMLEKIPTIYHLMPPVSRTETVITRFAPLHSNPIKFGLRRPRYHDCYNVLFSQDFLSRSGFKLNDFAYYFERTFEYGYELELLYGQLVLQVDHWKNLHRQRFVRLVFERTTSGLSFIDSRFSDRETTFTVSKLAAQIYKMCDVKPISHESICGEINESSSAIDDAIDELDKRRVIWRERNLILGVGIPKSISDLHEESGWVKRWPSLST